MTDRDRRVMLSLTAKEGCPKCGGRGLLVRDLPIPGWMYVGTEPRTHQVLCACTNTMKGALSETGRNEETEEELDPDAHRSSNKD